MTSVRLDLCLSPDRTTLPGGETVTLRDLRPDDETLYPEFHAAVSARDRQLRFFSPAPVSERQMHRLTHFDPAEVVARAAFGSDGQLWGVARIHRLADDLGEFAVMVRSDLKGRGLGRRLLEDALERAPSIGVTRVVGLILRENVGMLALAAELGFAIRSDAGEPGVLRASLDLRSDVSRAA